MSDGPIGVPPNTSSIDSLAPLKLMEYPPNAFFAAFAMCHPPKWWLVAARPVSRGYQYHRHEGEETKNPTARGCPPTADIPPTGTGGSAAREGRHHVAREPAQLLLEVLWREALGP